jgi:hypothetical protein
MFSYTSAISKEWLAIVFHDPKLGNIRNPFGHFFGHSSATLSAISYEKSIAFLKRSPKRQELVRPKERLRHRRKALQSCFTHAHGDP